MTKILLAEDHILVREGVRLLLSTEPTFEIVAETGDGAAVEQLVQDTEPALILLDLDLPGCRGGEIATHVKARYSDLKILVLTSNLQPQSVRHALACGADGYALKLDGSSELLQAIRAVLAGKPYISKSIASMFQSCNAETSTEPITPRERKIMSLIAHGMRNQEIAQSLAVSVFTVRTHRQNLMDKLQLRNAAEITAYAIQRGFYEPAAF